MRNLTRPGRLLLSLALAACALTAAAQTKTVTHEIKRGETIESIAKAYGTTAEAIRQANPNAGDYFFVGMKIQVPVGEAAGRPAETAPAAQSGVKAAAQPAKQSVAVADNTESTANEPQRSGRVENVGAGYPLRAYMSLHYMQGFEEGAKGSYGLGGTLMNFSGSYFGLSFLLNMNLGIVDTNSSTVNFGIGPNFNYILSERWSVLVPLYVALVWQNVPVVEIRESDGYFMGEYVGTSTWENDTSKTEFNWGFTLTPSVAFYYKNMTVGLGFVLSWAKGADKLGTGFIANIGYAI